jgi:hypothetical protein
MSNEKFEVFDGGAKVLEYDATLRLLTQAEVPDGLAGRVKARLARTASGKVIEFPSEHSAGAEWLRRAAAAAIFLAVSGGSWAVYTAANGALDTARKGTAPAVLPSQQPGDFGTASTMRKTNPLTAPVVQKQGTGTRDQGTGAEAGK